MSEELKFEFNDYVIAIDEPYENDCGYVSIGKKQSNGINIVFKSPNKGTVNWFIELQKYITDLQSQLDQANERLKGAIVPKFKIGQEVYKVYTKDQRFPFKVKIIGVKITQTEEKISVLCDTEEDGIEMGWYPEKILFETLEEAEKKLQELQNGDFSGE